MTEVVCNYAVARFRPYREPGEFVNVGVVFVCPETGYFDYLFETSDCRRVMSFFPELEMSLRKVSSLSRRKVWFFSCATCASIRLGDERKRS